MGVIEWLYNLKLGLCQSLTEKKNCWIKWNNVELQVLIYLLSRSLKMISSLLIFLSFTLHKINKRKLCSAIAQNICSICWVTTIHFRSNWIHTSSLACICQYKSIIRIILIYYCSWSLLYYSNVLIFFPDFFSKPPPYVKFVSLVIHVHVV